MQVQTFQPPSDQDLQYQAKEFYRRWHKKEYQQMLQDGTLQETLRLTAKNCRSDAEARIRQGVWPPEAWNAAIREVILQTPAD